MRFQDLADRAVQARRDRRRAVDECYNKLADLREQLSAAEVEAEILPDAEGVAREFKQAMGARDL